MNVAHASADRPPVSLTGESADHLLAVELHSSQPDVRIFQLYEIVPPPPASERPDDGVLHQLNRAPRIAAAQTPQRSYTHATN